MPRFCVSRVATPIGHHLVHNLDTTCPHRPELAGQLFLGVFVNCEPALAAARRHYLRSNGCPHCAPMCHSETVRIREKS